MTPTPDTRASLLIRVRDPADQAAWNEFVEIYRPVILRLARQKGLQEADAEDVAQDVLVAIAKAVQQREHDRVRAMFRTWLHRVAHNATLNALTRGKPDRGSGDSVLLAVLNQQELPNDPDADLLRLEHRREVSRWAVRHVRNEFHWSGVRDAWRGQPLRPDGLQSGEAALEATTSPDTSFNHDTVVKMLAPTDDDRKTSENWRSLRRAMGSVASLAFSPDGSVLASAGRWLTNGDSGTGVIMWDAQTGARRHTVFTEAGGGAQSMRYLDAETGDTLLLLTDQAVAVPSGGRWNDFAAAKRGRMLALGGVDGAQHGRVDVWDFSAPAAPGQAGHSGAEPAKSPR